MIIKSWSNLTISRTFEKKNGTHLQLNVNHKEKISVNHVVSNGYNMQA